MRWALVNGEYEYELFKEELGPVPPEKVSLNRNDSEFMFFYLNRDPNLALHSDQTYGKEYFQKLKNLGLHVPQVGQNSEAVPWYGKLTDLPTEKKLNSKIFSYELLNRLKLAPSFNSVINSGVEGESVRAKFPARDWMLKSPYHMSGVGQKIIRPGEPFPELSHPHIIEPLFQRLLDISWLYSCEDQSLVFYINRVSPEGRHYGGLVFQDPHGLEEYMETQNLSGVFRAFKDTSALILRELKKENLQQLVSGDGFIFQGENGPALHPMCEINYRYTMGALMNSLKKFLPEKGVGAFYLLKKIPDLDQKFLEWSPETKKGILYLTHENATNLAFIVCEENVDAIDSLAKKFFYTWGNRT